MVKFYVNVGLWIFHIPLDEVLNIMYKYKLLALSFSRDVCYEMLCMVTGNVQLSFDNLFFV